MSRITACSKCDHLPWERSPGAHGSASAGERAGAHWTYECLKAEQNFSRLSPQDLVIWSNPQRFGVGRNARRSWTIVRCLPFPSVWARSVASAVQSEYYIRPLQVMWLIPAAAGYSLTSPCLHALIQHMQIFQRPRGCVPIVFKRPRLGIKKKKRWINLKSI